MTNLLSTLANHATAEWEAVMPYPGSADYLGESVNLGNPEARAALLYAQLMPIPAAEDAPGEAVRPLAAVPAEPAREAADEAEDIQEARDAGDQAYARWLGDVYDEEEAVFYGELLAEDSEDAEDAEDAEVLAI